MKCKYKIYLYIYIYVILGHIHLRNIYEFHIFLEENIVVVRKITNVRHKKRRHVYRITIIGK